MKKTKVEEEYIPKRKVATKYEPWMCDKIIEIAEQGGHVANMCQAIGIASRDTFYRWLDEYDEFKEAYETSKMYSQAFYENLLLAGACGRIKNFNFNSVAMIMNNKFSDEYKRSPTGSTTEINIGSINSATIDTTKLLKKAADLTRQLQFLEDNDENTED